MPFEFPETYCGVQKNAHVRLMKRNNIFKFDYPRFCISNLTQKTTSRKYKAI